MWKADNARIELITKLLVKAIARKLDEWSVRPVDSEPKECAHLGIFCAHTVQLLRPRRCKSMDSPMIW